MYIEIVEDVRMRFPHRTDEFLEGFEVGLVVASMVSEEVDFNRVCMVGSLDQMREIACHFDYRLVVGEEKEGLVLVHFRYGKPKPTLRVVK